MNKMFFTLHIYKVYTLCLHCACRDNVVGIARQSGNQIPLGDEVYRTRLDRPWGLLSFLCNGVAGAWCWPTTHI